MLGRDLPRWSSWYTQASVLWVTIASIKRTGRRREGEERRLKWEGVGKSEGEGKVGDEYGRRLAHETAHVCADLTGPPSHTFVAQIGTYTAHQQLIVIKY